MTVSAARKAGDGILDEFQTAFCDSPAENIRLLAPAGSGKTMSLLWRCLSVYQAKGGSARFLVFTFTRAARDELRKRLASHQFNNIRSAIEIATLNSWGFKRVKQNFHSPRLNTTEAERSFCVQNALQPVWMRHDYVRKAIQAQAFSAGKTIMNLMDLMKSMAFLHRNSEKEIHQHLEALTAIGLRPILEYAFRDLRTNEDAFAQFDEQFKAFVPFWREACQHLIEQSMFTLEDQKYVALLDLQDQRKAGRRPVGAARITHLLIDEFQDINPLDLALIRELADWHGSALTIVGDDDQCIFEWRGATFRYIVEPKIHLAKDFHTFILEKNYRCPRNIVSHSRR
jgi:DNA helicase-2/ATP-dependent DNA helicase PcrA